MPKICQEISLYDVNYTKDLYRGYQIDILTLQKDTFTSLILTGAYVLELFHP